MLPIVRWTIGNVSKKGIDCLNLSIKNFIKLYQNKFNYYVCYNNIDLNKIKFLEKYSVNLLNQEEYKDSLCLSPIDNNPCWKLYPPRINSNVHEIFIDNDLIIYNKIPIIDEFLKSNNFFIITEAYKRSYGSLDNLIKNKLNSGFIGLPPFFDFKEKINNIIEKYNIKWEDSIFEEQSVVAKILEENNFKIINLDEIYVCYNDIKISKYGLHFVGLNTNSIARFWNIYKNKL